MPPAILPNVKDPFHTNATTTNPTNQEPDLLMVDRLSKQYSRTFDLFEFQDMQHHGQESRIGIYGHDACYNDTINVNNQAIGM